MIAKVSCLTVSRGHPNFMRQAINGFNLQTHPNKELVIVTDAPKASLAALQHEFAANPIRWIWVPESSGLSLGQLRNISIEQAMGAFIAQWDDDDLYHPQRIHLQLQALTQHRGQACMLARWVVWWPAKQRLFLSPKRPWEGSLICQKEVMPRYPNLEKGEDTPAIKELISRHRVIMLDAPGLYVYVVHGQNTWDEQHFEKIYKHTTLDFSGPNYETALKRLTANMDVNIYPL